MNTTTVTTPNELEIRVERTFDAPRAHVFSVVTSSASSSSRTCFFIPVRDMPNGSASSLIVALPKPSRSRTARRVGSARAANARSTVGGY